MVDLPNSHRDALERHVGEGEKLQTATTTESNPSHATVTRTTTSAVSDRRFYRVRRNSDNAQVVDAISLDNVSSLHIERHPDGKPGYGVMFIGALVAVMGLVVATSGAFGGVSVVVGGLSLFVGIIIAAFGMDTEDGHVALELRTPSDELTETYALDDYFPESVSQQVAER